MSLFFLTRKKPKEEGPGCFSIAVGREKCDENPKNLIILNYTHPEAKVFTGLRWVKGVTFDNRWFFWNVKNPQEWCSMKSDYGSAATVSKPRTPF